MKQKIFLAADHAGFEMKEFIKKSLLKEGHDIVDKGALTYDKEDDYPDFIIPAAIEVVKHQNSKGIIFGGSGQGEANAANKVDGIRAVVYNCENLDLIKLSREHNDANVLSIGARFMSNEHALEAIRLWLSANFSRDKRHVRRIEKIAKFEK